MKTSLWAIGKTRESWIRQGMDEYLKRLNKYLPFEYKEFPDVKGRSSISEKEIKKKELELISKHLKPSDHLILLDENGKSFTSVGLATWWQKQNLSSVQHQVILIGGAYGFHEDLVRRSQMKIALSPMTFSHQMVRVIALEQIYRAQTIIKGEPYHHV